jgi:hypothetical protein
MLALIYKYRSISDNNSGKNVASEAKLRIRGMSQLVPSVRVIYTLYIFIEDIVLLLLSAVRFYSHIMLL